MGYLVFDKSQGEQKMALIKCPECGNEVSDKAAACPRCAYPIGQQAEMNSVEMSFDCVSGQIFNNGCTVFGPSGETLAKCRQGDTIAFECKAPMKVTVKMSGCFGKPTVTVEPGKKYQVSITGMGSVRVQEVSRIRQPKKTGYWGSW